MTTKVEPEEEPYKCEDDSFKSEEGSDIGDQLLLLLKDFKTDASKDEFFVKGNAHDVYQKLKEETSDDLSDSSDAYSR